MGYTVSILSGLLLLMTAAVIASVADSTGPQRCSEVAAMSFAGQPAIYSKCIGATFGITGRSTLLRLANGESI